jgi:hypothetical protein
VRHALGAVIAYGVRYLLLADDDAVVTAVDSLLATALESA